MVELVWLVLRDRSRDASAVGDVTVLQDQALGAEVDDAIRDGGGRATKETDDGRVRFAEELRREPVSVLARDAGDDGGGHIRGGPC
jgi:hypothetical protein